MPQTPTIGRIVIFREGTMLTGRYPIDRAAIIVATASTRDSTCVDVQVDLCVLGRFGTYFRHEVPFSDQAEPSADTWRWPERI